MPEDAAISRYAQRKRVSHIISLAADRIWLNSYPLYYFSIADTTTLSEERALRDALLDLFFNGMCRGRKKSRWTRRTIAASRYFYRMPSCGK